MNVTKWKTNRTLRVAPGASRIAAPAAFVLFCLLGSCSGQGTMTITFEGPPPQPSGIYSYVSTYSESGMLFVDGPYCLLRVGSGVSWAPDNGTACLGPLVNTTVVVNSLSGTLFSLVSIDAGEFTGLPNPGFLHVVGFRQDGTTVTNNLAPSGINFQTFHFDSGFVDLNRLEMSGGYALDNLVVGVPEPSAGVLFVLGTLTTLGWSWFRRSHLPRC